MKKNNDAVFSMLKCMADIVSRAEELRCDSRDEVVEKVAGLSLQLEKILSDSGLIKEPINKKVKRLKRILDNLDCDISFIGSIFANLDVVLKKNKMEITEQSEDEYHFKTLDGNFSGVVLYDTSDGTFYIDDCVHIYDKEFGTKGWEYSIGDDAVYSI